MVQRTSAQAHSFVLPSLWQIFCTTKNGKKLKRLEYHPFLSELEKAQPIVVDYGWACLNIEQQLLEFQYHHWQFYRQLLKTCSIGLFASSMTKNDSEYPPNTLHHIIFWNHEPRSPWLWETGDWFFQWFRVLWLSFFSWCWDETFAITWLKFWRKQAEPLSLEGRIS